MSYCTGHINNLHFPQQNSITLLLIIQSCWEILSTATENEDLATEIKSSLTEYTGSRCMEKKPITFEELHLTT